jgi:hypothetical protein
MRARVKWFILQCRKECSTLRITPKGEKAEPKIIERFGSGENEIRKYLEYKSTIPSLVEKYRKLYTHSYGHTARTLM